MQSSDTYSVTEFIDSVNQVLENVPARIVGEVSELKIASSGHVYFTLKDKDTGYVLPCTLWARDYQYSSVDLEMGMEVLVVGRANFYGPFGKMTFNAKSVELVGEGALKKAYEKLKHALSQEGLFDAARKREIPLFPHRIGIITSMHGAVIHDFSNNLGKFGFKLIVHNTKVEGPESGRELALTVRAMRNENIDVLVLIRGGGSMQSLAGFDNEELVREIASFPVPVLAGVGHHQDITLAALVADANESTPSLVATLINTSWEEARRTLERSEQMVLAHYDRYIDRARRLVETHMLHTTSHLSTLFSLFKSAQGVLQSAYRVLEYEYKKASYTMQQSAHNIFKNFHSCVYRVRTTISTSLPHTLFQAYHHKLSFTKNSFESFSRSIQSNSPEHQLKFGYSIVYVQGKVLRSIAHVKKGDKMNIQLHDGIIKSQVIQNE